MEQGNLNSNRPTLPHQPTDNSWASNTSFQLVVGKFSKEPIERQDFILGKEEPN